MPLKAYVWVQIMRVSKNKPEYNEENLSTTSTENNSDFKIIFEHDIQITIIGALLDIMKFIQKIKTVCVFSQV